MQGEGTAKPDPGEEGRSRCPKIMAEWAVVAAMWGGGYEGRRL